MSLEAWGDDDGGSVFDAAYDAGFWSPDDIDELRGILKLVDVTKPALGDKSAAVLVLMAVRLEVIPTDDPLRLWAQSLLREELSR